MERARRRASNDLDAAIANNMNHDFDPARPWEFVFKRAAGETCDPTAARYWHLHLEEPCLLIVAGARKVDGFIDGDASVCLSSAGHMATQGSPAFSLQDGGASRAGHKAPERRPPAPAQPPAKRRALQDTPANVSAQIVDGKYTTNRAGNSLCTGFNTGHCNDGKKNNIFCPKDGSLRHNCHLCLSSSHGAHECTSGKTPTGKGGAKGKGRGGNKSKR